MWLYFDNILSNYIENSIPSIKNISNLGIQVQKEDKLHDTP
jgi:hypothetical protein